MEQILSGSAVADPWVSGGAGLGASVALGLAGFWVSLAELVALLFWLDMALNSPTGFRM